MTERRYQVSRTIDAPAATIWALLTESQTYPEWNQAVISIEGPIQQGNSIKLVSVADPKRTFKLKVTEMEAPRRMVWSSGMPLGLFGGNRTYTITDRADGRSDFTMVEEFTGPLAGLITRAIPDLTESFEAFADSLKETAEAQTTG